jgi:hypothetical protein
MTQEQVLSIINSRGWFRASWRWRDSALRKLCGRMAHKGLIRKVRSAPGWDWYEKVHMPTRAAEAAQ